MTTQNEFVERLRDALGHLYDYRHLESRPLALQYWPDLRSQGPGRGYRLSRLLLETIEELHPPALSSHAGSSRARAYELLVRRYVDEKPLPQLLHDMGCSRRQFFREQQKALAMLANMLYEKLPQQTPAEPDDQLGAEARRVLDQDETIDLRRIIASVQELTAQLADQHGVVLALDPGSPLPAVRGSRTLLRQVFLEVLSRLIALPGVRRVELEVGQQGQRVLVEWLATTDGSGQQRDHTPDDLSTALTAVCRLLGIMGGNWRGIEVRPNAYVCRFDFPVDPQRVLLVIEDNEGVIRAFRRQLASYNYTVVGATTGDEALRLAREVAPVAITLDVMMPAEDGWDILQKLKNDPATWPIPVVVCSVLENPDLAHSLGAQAHLRKPISQASLLTVLNRLVGAR